MKINVFQHKKYKCKSLISMKIMLFYIILFTTVFSGQICYASLPYTGYEYRMHDYKAVPAPVAFIPEKTVDGKSLGIGNLKDPADIFIDNNENVYILDSGNGRIICTDSNFNEVKFIITSYNSGGAGNFIGAQGIFVYQDIIYIADTENSQILVLKKPVQNEINHTAEVLGIIEAPVIENMKNNFVFKPTKIIVNSVGRIYVVSSGVYEGLVELSSEGEFRGFVGANRVKASAWDIFWKSIATKKQRNAMVLFVPVEFSNVSIDEEGFIYTTAKGTSNNQIVRRLNLNGVDILTRNSEIPINGDIINTVFSGNNSEESFFMDVSPSSYGIYSCLDATRGRVFTYDSDCNLLFVFGALQNQDGAFKNPTALSWLGNKIIVLDGGYNELTIFMPTEYGSNIINAIAYQYKGEYDKSASEWSNVIKINANNESAYIGVGKALLRQENYTEAMKYFKLGNSREFYSKAYEFHRKDTVTKYLPSVILIIGIISVIYLILKSLKYLKKMKNYFKCLYDEASKLNERKNSLKALKNKELKLFSKKEGKI